MFGRLGSMVVLLAMCVCARVGAEAGESAPEAADLEQAVAAEGSLVICGGGALPEEALVRFVDLAGGPEGRLVVIPTAGADGEAQERTKIIRRWTDRGLRSVAVLHTRDRNEADSEAFVAPLGEATAVWFRGGLQSRLADSYVGTATERAIVDVYRRGGVVGGTSAGAAIQSRVMIESGNPTPKITTGLDLLPDAIVDQHFLQRDRFNRLLTALREHPGRIGVGIDEGTAVVYRGSECRVLGSSYVTVVTAPAASASPSVRTFRGGQAFRLDDSPAAR